MKLLAIETSTRRLGIALLDGERLLSSYELLADNPHAAELPSAVNRTLDAAHLSLKDIEALAVDIGPGSFTGLRIGLAFVKALAFGVKKQVIGISSLDILAAGLPFQSRSICPILDAKQGNVYTALFRTDEGKPVKQTDYLLGPIEQVLEEASEPCVFLGDGCALYRERIIRRSPSASFIGEELWMPGAGVLARLGHERLAEGLRDEPGSLVPMYLYPHTCTIRLSERLPSAPRKTPQAV